MKKCSKCGIEKPRSDFQKSNRYKDGLRSDCKQCKYAATNAWKARNKKHLSDYRKSWYEKNHEHALSYAKQYRSDNPEKKINWNVNNKERIKLKCAAWYEANRDRCAANAKKWMRENKDRVNRTTAKRRANRFKATPSWADHEKIREIYKRSSEMDGMNVDHIVPLNSSVVCGLHVHYNLQLLPKIENIKKSNRYWPDMP